jgi:hypothetical protein
MFQGVNHWDLALGAVAAYVAVVTLARLMALHRDRLLAQFRAQVESQHRRRPRFGRERIGGEAPEKKPDGRRNTAA